MREIGVLPTLFAMSLAFAASSMFAQAQSVGEVVSYQKTEHGIMGRTANTSFAVSIYSDQVIRLQVSREQKPHSFSYALVNNAAPHYAGFSVEDSDGNKIDIKTASLILEIEKTPQFRAVFKDAQGTS